MDGSGPNYVSLSQYGREVGNVVWSADLRIAVTTPTVVFISVSQWSVIYGTLSKFSLSVCYTTLSEC